MFGRLKPLKWSAAKLAYFDNWQGTLSTGAAILANSSSQSYEIVAMVKVRLKIIRDNCPR